MAGFDAFERLIVLSDLNAKAGDGYKANGVVGQYGDPELIQLLDKKQHLRHL